MRHLIKICDEYIVWSTWCKSPITMGLNLQQLNQYAAYIFYDKIPEDVIKLTDQYGCSSGIAVDELINDNRAGRFDTKLSKEQIIEYFIMEKDPHKPLPIGTKVG